MCSLTKGIFIVGAKRTPFGSLGGKLSSKSLTDLSEVASKAALQAANLDSALVDSVIIGNVRTVSSSDGGYLARHVGLRCGIPQEAPAFMVNRMCGSGFQAIVSGAHGITMGESSIVLTGGSEVMSGAPFLIRGSRFGIKLGVENKLDDSLWQGFTDLGCNTSMGMTAENLAVKYKIPKEEADQFALESQQRWANAHANGYFAEELAPVQVTVKGKPVKMIVDEHPKPGTTIEGLRKLRPAFKPGDGIVTAGNASGINDGAGAVIIASEDAVTRHNLKPLARVVGYSIVGVEPTIMGIGPVPAIQNLLKLTGLRLDDIDLVEINEAFAPQVLACQRELHVDPARLNVNGGAIAMGHPVGASGARITGHLVYELRRRGKKYGIGSACIGGGQGIALLIESCC